MKKAIKTIFFTAFALIGAALFGVLACQNPPASDNTAAVAEAYSVYDLLTPKIISFYEENISQKPIVSSIREQKLERMAAALNIDVKKMTAVILIQDLAARTNKQVDLKTLASMKDGQLFKTAKGYANDYLSTLSEEEKQELEAKFKGKQ